MIRASWLTLSAADAGRSLHLERTVTILRPVSQVVSLKITGKQKYTWNIDSDSTWGTVVTAAAEIGAELFADFIHFL